MRLLQHLVVPTFVIDAQRRVVVWNRACERLTGVAASEVLGTSKHWQAFYEKRRYCLADLVAIGRQDKIGELYTEYVQTSDESLGSSAENWCVMPRLGNHLYLAIDAGPIHRRRRQPDRGGGNAARHDRPEAGRNGAADACRQGRADRACQPPLLRPGAGTGMDARGCAAASRWRCCLPTSIISSASTIVTAIRAATNACARWLRRSARMRSGRPTLPPAMAARSSPSSCPTPTWRPPARSPNGCARPCWI